MHCLKRSWNLFLFNFPVNFCVFIFEFESEIQIEIAQIILFEISLVAKIDELNSIAGRPVVQCKNSVVQLKITNFPSFFSLSIQFMFK